MTCFLNVDHSMPGAKSVIDVCFWKGVDLGFVTENSIKFGYISTLFYTKLQ